MSRLNSESLLGLTESFFKSYLQHTRGASVHTVRAYRDALKLFYLFLASHKRKPLAGLALEDIQSDAVLAFLDHVESQRGNSAVTRNCRLDRKSTRLNSSHVSISYAVFCLKK